MNDKESMAIESKLVSYGYDVHNDIDPWGFDEVSLMNLKTKKEVWNWNSVPKKIRELARQLITGPVPPYDSQKRGI